MDEINTSDLATFLSLDDTPAEYAAMKPEAPVAPVEEIAPNFVDEEGNEYYGDFDDTITDFSDFDFTGAFEGEEGYEAPAEEAVEEEVTEEDSDDNANVNDDVVAEDEEPTTYDEMDVDYDTVLTLPDGRDVTIEELANGFMSGEALNSREEAIRELARGFEARVEGMRDSIELCILEADRVIADYDGFDWAKLAMEDREAYVENMEFLNRYQKRRQELQTAFDKVQADKADKEKNEYQAQCQKCVETLVKSIPNWNDQLYSNLLDYAVTQGANADAVAKENRPEYFQMLYKAYQFDNGKAQVMAKIKKAQSPKKGLTASTTSTRDNAGKDMAKARAAKAAQEGKLSQKDMFKFLND